VGQKDFLYFQSKEILRSVFMSKRYNPIIIILFIFAFVFALMPPQTPVSAATSELFFSEYIEASSYNKALEIYNGTGATIDLAAESYSIRMSFNGGTSTYTINLTGTVADGDVYVVAPTNATDATILAQADQLQGASWFNGDDAVILLKNGVVIDVIGQIGFDPGSEWGSDLTSTADNTLRRKTLIVAGDPDGSNPFDPSIEWDGYANNTFDGLGSHLIVSDPAEPLINEFVFNHTGTDNYEYAEVYGDPNTDYSAYTLLQIEGDTSGSGVVDSVTSLGTTDAAGFWWTGYLTNVFENGTVSLLLVSDFSGSAGMDLDDDNDGVLDLAPWTAIVDAVAISDGGTGDHMYTATVLGPDFDGIAFTPGGASRFPDGASVWVRNDFDLAGIPSFPGSIGPDEAYNTPGTNNQIYVPPPEACGDVYTPIYTIQGSGLASDLDGSEVATEGVVVGDFQSGKNGFYLQDVSGDSDPATSDGIFVYFTGTDVNVGDYVRVRGIVDEYFDLTEITNVSQVWFCSTADLPEPIQLSLPVSAVADFEAYEGMLVTFPQVLYISEYFNFDRYGEIVLTTERQYQPTAVYEPGSPEAALLAQNNLLGRILLDDGRTSQNPDPAYHPNGQVFTLDNLFRGGDQVQNLTGVMDYYFDLYRIQPTQGADYIPSNPRTSQPENVGSDLKVASFNVLNYFTTLGSRGADTPEEFQRQRDKIFAALAAIDTDVVGLIEIENNGLALQNLVSGLNALLGSNVYAYVETGTIGTDEITVAIIYKPSTVSLVGDFAVLDDPAFTDPLSYGGQLNRPALAQTFIDKNNGGIFTVVVNHLKSKGSECGEGDDDLEQGSCNLTRTLAAQALTTWLASDPTDSGDGDFLIIGDLNSYDKEDPINAFETGGFIDTIRQFQGEYAYSYVFDGQLGYLDHALANSDLFDEITGVTVWHINADEPDLIDYDMSFKQDDQDALYAPDAYRSSDHDPVIVGLGVCDEIAPTVTVDLSQDTLWPVNHKFVTVQASVIAADNFDPAPAISLVSVTSNEPDDGLGDGDTPNDIVIIDDFTFELRAERSGTGNDRVYTITYQVTDACGNSTLTSVSVTVPHNN